MLGTTLMVSISNDDVINWKQSTGHRWIPLTTASDAELWCFLWSAPEQAAEQTIETPVILDAIALIITSLWCTSFVLAGPGITSFAMNNSHGIHFQWWRHQMETFSALLALCEGNRPVTGRFPSRRPATRKLDVFCDLRLNKRLSKQLRLRWFETPSRPLYTSLWCTSFVWAGLRPDSFTAKCNSNVYLR